MRIPSAFARFAILALAAPAGVTLLALAAANGSGREPAPGSTAAGEIAYALGRETVPNGSFDRVGPKWQQLRPDEGEKLAVIPEGWLVGYEGGERRMPLAAKDPATGDRCMDFLYGAGRVDLLTPPIELDGPGAYLLSLRTRSVVAPTDRALRVVVRLLPPEEQSVPPAGGVAPSAEVRRPEAAAPAAPSLHDRTKSPSPTRAPPGPEGKAPARQEVFEMLAGAGPEERVWTARTALIQVRAEFTRAEVHLIKDEELADFLLDDVSLRRIDAAPRDMGFDVPAGDAAWTSPVLYLGAVASASIEIEPSPGTPQPSKPEASAPFERPVVEARTGVSPAPGDSWEGWQVADAGGSAPGPPIHLFAEGVALYGQLRVSRPGSPGALRLGLHLTPAKEAVASREITFTRIDNPPAGSGEGWKSLTLPPAGSCPNGLLTPLRALALEATSGAPDDLARARALRGALRCWVLFTAGGDPPAKSAAPAPAAVLEDCRRPTPLYCRGWEGDLVTGACLCAGMVCRSVSSAAAGAPEGGLEGFEVWSRELGRWAFLPYREEPDAVEMSEPPSALALAAASGKPVAVAMDLRWGRKGYVVFGAGQEAGSGEESMDRETAPAEAIEFPINAVHADLAATGDRSFEVRLEHDVPGFERYVYRHAPSLPWKPVEAKFEWKLIPGDNDLEIRAENGQGGTSRVTFLRARLDRSPAARLAPYAGLRALSGDPHVHTGLGLYRIVDPNHPLARGTPEKAFESAIRNGLDWAAVTDFSQHIDDPRTLAWRAKDHLLLKNPDGTETASEWEHLKAVVRKANQPGRFAAFLGVEFDGGGLSSKGGTGRKIILLPDDTADTYCSPMVQVVGDCPQVEDAYRYTRARGGVMIASSPCSTLRLEDTDWDRYDPVVSLLDLYGGACESTPGGFKEASVYRGLPVGAAGGSDDRKGVAGLWDRTICWAAEASRGPILDAIRARRCYWSAAGHLDLAFTVNGAPMGAEVAAGGVTAWSAEAVNRTAPPFASVEILRDGIAVASAACESSSRCLLEGGVGERWPGVYYAAVNGTDGLRLAITSPVRVVGELIDEAAPAP